MIYLTINEYHNKDAYAFVNYATPVICIAANLKVWATDEMQMTPDEFMKRVAGTIAHESIHVVLDELLEDGFKVSPMLDNLFNTPLRGDDGTDGLWNLDQALLNYGTQ